MTSIDSGIEAECESNDCTDHSSVCHNNTMSVVPFTPNPKTSYDFVQESLRCAGNIMAQPSTSSSSASESFHSFFDRECPNIVIVGYNDDRAPHKVIADHPRLRRKEFNIIGGQLNNMVGGVGHFTPGASDRFLCDSRTRPTINKRSYRCRRFRMVSYFDKIHNDKIRSLVQCSFHQAACTNNSEKLLIMIHRGVDPNITDECNRTALHKAASKGYTDSVKVLLENGAKPNLRDNVGNTALHLAACTNHIDVITLLLKHGCDASSTDFSGRSPLQLAQSKLKILAKSKQSSSIETLKTEILKVIDMLLLFIERKQKSRPGAGWRTDPPQTESSGYIRPATLSLDPDNLPGKLSFDAAKNSHSPAGSKVDTNAELSADIELLNLFQTRMKLSENVEGDLDDLMNNLDQLKIAIDTKPSG
ncbi:hypothetical protein M8J77_023260 [Diaphorina citri]|nr:hypothetical protein M8J77_023260 [Diaphorina citri]